MSTNRRKWRLSGEPAKEPLRYKGCELDDVHFLSRYPMVNRSAS